MLSTLRLHVRMYECPAWERWEMCSVKLGSTAVGRYNFLQWDRCND